MRDSVPVVILTNLQMPHLVFHRRLPWVREGEIRYGSAFTSKTIQVFVQTWCGAPLYYCTYDEDLGQHNRDGRMRGIFIRLEHARKIARPCQRCFPWGPPL